MRLTISDKIYITDLLSEYCLFYQREKYVILNVFFLETGRHNFATFYIRKLIIIIDKEKELQEKKYSSTLFF